jgi:hypothetical protein
LLAHTHAYPCWTRLQIHRNRKQKRRNPLQRKKNERNLAKIMPRKLRELQYRLASNTTNLKTKPETVSDETEKKFII